MDVGGGGPRFNEAPLLGLFVVRTPRGLACVKDWKPTLLGASSPVLSLAVPSL